MQLTMKLTFADSEQTVTTNLMTIVAWERKYKRKASQISDGIGIEDLAFWRMKHHDKTASSYQRY